MSEDNRSGVIYKITNLKNGFVYVGKTTMLPKYRYSAHVSKAKAGGETPLHLAMRENDFDKSLFPFEIIEEGEAGMLDSMEAKWIHDMKKDGVSLYNLQSGGTKGRKVAKDTKIKISRLAGVAGEIVVYNWIDGEFVGLYQTGADAMSGAGLSGSPNLAIKLREGYFVGKDKVLFYKGRSSELDLILSKVRAEYVGEKLVENMNCKKVNRATKLTEEIVTKVILDIINGDSNGLIAEKYGISRQSITDINYRRTWRHVKIDGYESVSVYKMSRKSRHS